MTRILLLNDNSEQNNWGAQASPYAIERMLRDAIPGVTIESFSHSWLGRQFWHAPAPWKGRVYEPARLPRGIRGAVNRMSQPREFFPCIADDFDYVADEWMAGRGGPMATEFMEAAKECDAIVHNGENSMYRNTVAGCRALFLLWLAKTRLGKPSCEINQTAALSTMNRPIMSGMTKLVYPRLDLVTVREVCSLEDLVSLGVPNAKLVPDVVFYLDESEYATGDFREWAGRVGLDDRPYFCFSASAMPMSEARPGWEGLVVELVRALKRIVPQAVLMAKDSHCLFLEEVARATGSIYFGPEHSFREIWPLLRDARFLISGHFHYVIMGAAVGCPFIPFATNNHKMEGVCRHLEWHLTTPYDGTAIRYCTESICADAQHLVDNRDSLSKQLLERASQLQTEAANNALFVKNLL